MAAAAALASAGVCAPTASAKTDVAGTLDALSRIVVQNLTQRGVSNTSFDLPSYLWVLTHPEGPGSRNLPRANQKTLCRTVIQIGDSTSVGLDNSLRVGSPTDRTTEQYHRIGVQNVYLNAMNGRAVVERIGDEPSGLDAIRQERALGHDGCWLIALGANDAARIGHGSTISARRRIDMVMRELPGRPVLWPTVMTDTTGVYDTRYMRSFNAELKRATARYPNLRVFDFARYPKPSWYVDGVHYTEDAMIQRNRLFALGLATKFPQH
ncbi:SGNH/GDSL hydrolase family protein [Gordonia phthalatica]|uniref:SGNH/GDSL hydrolase family protein n=1 Tax=Gordonia phthalatica TaxID=1136941 RepID=UPI001D04B998|nr:SGNH/GDSL hydrolase family protein [Gordonia phthalatica]